MTKKLLSCIRWLEFTGIVSSSDIGFIAADLRLFGHFLMTTVFLVPRVMYDEQVVFRALNIAKKNRDFTDFIRIYTGG